MARSTVSLSQIYWLLLMAVLVAGCRTQPPPTPTPLLLFATATPAPTGAAGLPTPTLVAPTSLPATATPTLPPLPTATPSPIIPPTFTPFPTVTPVLATPTPIKPYAVIDSPQGSLNVRPGPGLNYVPVLGGYNNGAVVDIIGKQYSPDGELWWLIPFVGGPFGQGWIYAGYTTAYNTGEVPWVNPPPLPPTPTPTLPPIPHAIIDSPDGFVYVRSGPGLNYPSTLGTINNGFVVDLIGKQYSTDNELWWLIPFTPSTSGQGWIYAKHTIARYTSRVPWVTAPPTPAATPVTTATPTSTTTPTLVTWRVSGRVVEAGTNQPVAGATVNARLGNDGSVLTAATDGNGQFILTGYAHDDGNLVLTISAPNFRQQIITAGPTTPRFYNFPAIELVREQSPPITWTINGRVIEQGTAAPIPGAQVEAILGESGVRLNTGTNANGDFSMSGQAPDMGLLTVNVTAAGYESYSITPNQTAPRTYNLGAIQLASLITNCRYESVLQVNQSSALSRLLSLGFTAVVTQPVNVAGDPALVDLVLTQEPPPPSPDQLVRLDCATSIRLGVGVSGP
jgi:hypothetical protein